jgi:hypothetical protein
LTALLVLARTRDALASGVGWKVDRDFPIHEQGEASRRVIGRVQASAIGWKQPRMISRIWWLLCR